MAKNTRWSSDDFRKQGLIETPNGFIKAAKLVNTGKVDKIKLPPEFVSVKNINALYPDGRVEPVLPKANRKIKNAVKSEVDGVKFDSNLEKYMYGLLKGAGITFEFQVEYLLQEKFRYGKEAIRAITLTVDFWLPTRNMIIDTKGYANDRAPMKYKMLKWYLFQEVKRAGGDLPIIETPSNKKECDLLLNKILYCKL